MSRERDYRWYIEPRDAHTNRVIADALEHSGVADADAQPSVLCDDGVHRALWTCSHDTISKLNRSGMRDLDYTIWVAEGQGKPRQWKFLAKKKSTVKKTRPVT